MLTGREVSSRQLSVPGSANGGWQAGKMELVAERVKGVKASGAFWRAWGLGMVGGFLSPEGVNGLYETLVIGVGVCHRLG